MIQKISYIVSVLTLATMGLAQRPGYAGSMPHGYPVIVTTTSSTPMPMTMTDSLGNRFGNELFTTTTPRLPIEANGDVNLINYLSKLPRDQQPFWFLNWQALEQNRNQPKTYPIKQSGYIDFASHGDQGQFGFGPEDRDMYPRF